MSYCEYDFRNEVLDGMAEAMQDDPKVPAALRAKIKLWVEQKRLDEKIENVMNNDDADDDKAAATENKAVGIGDGTPPPEEPDDGEDEGED